MPPNLTEMTVARWPAFLGHALTVGTLALGGLSSFHALKSDVVELRAVVTGQVQVQAADAQRLRDECRELRAEFRELKQHLLKGGVP